ncbi:Ion-translocating oxidoreductase complex subunit C [Mannheimia haemolytica]
MADKRCKLLVINGAECEPYITCDDRLMQDFTADLIEGIRILRYVLRPEEVVIAIEDNKPHAIQALETALKGSNDMFVRAIPTKYPSGASDQLIQVLTGLEIPAGKRTIEMGIVMHNVGTAFAVKRAIIDDEPLIERVVTLTGDKIRNKGNVWARLGTPIQHLLEQVDYQADKRFPVFLGGPMMGFILPALQAPITKTANCLIAPDHFEYAPPEPERSCIRCSSCSDACPVGLLPQQLYWFARAEDHDKSKEYHLDACIECGVCAYVCPSYIPLIQYFRQEKAKIEEIEEKARKAEEAKIRFEAREARLQKERDARTARISQAAEKRREEVANAGGVDPVKAALERLKAKKAVETVQEIPAEVQVKPNGEPDNSDLMAQRRARRLAKQAEQAVEKSENVTNALIGANNDLPLQSMNETASDKSVGANNYSPEAESEDPRKAAVAAALARAKAKKQAQQAVEKSENITNAVIGVNNDLPLQSMNETVSDKSVGANNHSPETESEDPRKAAVAAAIARAKAKKQAQQAVEKPEDIANAVIGVNNDLPLQSMNETTSDKSVGANNHSPKTESEDPRKAAVAAAIARAKAKKAAQQEKSNNV